MGIQRLVLLCPFQELPPGAAEEDLEEENKLKSLATRALDYTWDEEASELIVAEEASVELVNTEEDPADLLVAEVDAMKLLTDEEVSVAQDLLDAEKVS